MHIDPNIQVAELATSAPATIKVFQQHQIDFCCGGKLPLAEACARAGLDTEVVLAELEQALADREAAENPATISLTALIAAIQARYHEPLRLELPRLSAMLDKVVSRHGESHADVLYPLRETFRALQGELLDHMAKEDRILFPTIVQLETSPGSSVAAARWLAGPIGVMEHDHEDAGRALARMRQLTTGYAPPEGACPTFRGLYYGLSELERDMHLHVHLENNVLFPRALALAREHAGALD